MRRASSKFRIFLPLFALSFLTDCASKRAVVEHLSPANVPHEVLGDVVQFTLAYNVRAAMGLTLGPQSRWLLAALAVLLLVGVAEWLRRVRNADPMMLSGVALIAGGALGNLLDRIRWDRGVVDFIDIGFGHTRFWIFNIADAAITIGAVLLWLAMRREERTQSDGPAGVTA